MANEPPIVLMGKDLHKLLRSIEEKVNAHIQEIPGVQEQITEFEQRWGKAILFFNSWVRAEMVDAPKVSYLKQ